LIDHLVYATPDLATTVGLLTDRLGTAPTPGGAHPGRGTRNALVGLGDGAYLEIIGPDLEQPAPLSARPFGIDTLSAPALAACGSSSSNSGSGSSSGSGSNSSSSSGSAQTKAYGGSSSSGASASGGAATTVSESEFKLTPKDASVKAGKVTITVKNTGTITHALSLEKAGPGGKDVESGAIQPGQTKTITATLKKGKIEWYCPIGNHKAMGMVGDLTVT